MMKQLYQTLQPTVDTQSQFRYEHIITPVLEFLMFNGLDESVTENAFVVAKVIWLPNGNNYLIYSGISPGLTRFYCLKQ